MFAASSKALTASSAAAKLSGLDETESEKIFFRPSTKIFNLPRASSRFSFALVTAAAETPASFRRASSSVTMFSVMEPSSLRSWECISSSFAMFF